jgi:hypothetical protein
MIGLHEKNLADLAILDMRERDQRIKRAYEAYYYGGPDMLRYRAGEANDNVKINYARLVVDAGVAHLFGSALVINAPEGNDDIQQEIDAIIKANGGGLLWQRMGVSGAIGGTMFYRLMVNDDESIRVMVVDPATVEVLWDERDHEKVTGYVVTFVPNGGAGARAIRQIIQPADDGWQIVEQEAFDDAWQTVSIEPWPYPFPPMGHAQNLPSPHEVYGISDLEPDTLDLCDGINRAISNINRILRLYAHPRTWGKMIGEALNMDANPGAVIRLEHPDAELHNLEMQSDLSSSIDLYRRMVGALHESSRIPEVATGKLDSAGSLSSLALRILYAPLMQKTETKRRTYGHAIEEMFLKALYLRGFEDVDIELLWPDTLPADPEGTRRNALVDQQLGVSRTTILEALGYDPEVEDANREAEGTQAQAGFDAGLI